MTAIGTRRPREGRCERCEKPLTDLVWETWESIAPWGAPLPPVTDWREQDGTDTHCAGDPFCDAPEIDWCARALAAETDLADAEARGRQEGLLAAALGIQSAYTARQREVVMPDHEEKPMEHHLYAATLYIDREVTARAMGAVIDVAEEATDGR